LGRRLDVFHPVFGRERLRFVEQHLTAVIEVSLSANQHPRRVGRSRCHLLQPPIQSIE
jgi:hypothetical protein